MWTIIDRSSVGEFLRGGRSQNTTTLIMEHKITDNIDDILNIWKEHFETLSTVDLNENLDYGKYHLCLINSVC
jgi:hypothetical protein